MFRVLSLWPWQAGAPQCTCQGAFTLEAAVILPLLACFFVSLLFFFRVMQVQLEVQNAMDETGRMLAVYAGSDNGKKLSESAWLAAATARMLSELPKESATEQYVCGGRLGVSLLSSGFSGDNIELIAKCEVKLPVELLGKRSVRLTLRTVCRKWSGWNGAAAGEESDGDVWVYVTEDGSVYHALASCTHLKLTISSVEYARIQYLRNENGEKYNPCERCAAKSITGGQVYITEQGNRYHKDLNCSGLKRTVHMVRMSEADGYAPCSRCAQKED